MKLTIGGDGSCRVLSVDQEQKRLQAAVRSVVVWELGRAEFSPII